MLKKTPMLLLMLCSAFLASSQALQNMKDRLKGRVVHVETLLFRGRWLWQNDNKDADGSRYLWFDLLHERDTYYTPRVQFKATECGSHLCFESVSLRNYYLASGFPAGSAKQAVKLQHSTYVKSNNRFHWNVMCENDSLQRCKFVPVRFLNEGWILVAENWGDEKASRNGGHYDATLGKDESKGWFRVNAPNPTDSYEEIYSNINKGTSPQEAEYSTTVGVTTEKSTSHTLTVDVSFEIGVAFAAFSASSSTSISNTWETASSSSFSDAKTVTHKITIPPRTRIVLKQLIGQYAGIFKVGDDHYMIEEISLDTGAKKEIIKRYRPKVPNWFQRLQGRQLGEVEEVLPNKAFY